MAQVIVGKEIEFKDKDTQNVCDRLGKYIYVYRHLDEYLSAADKSGCPVCKEEYDALKNAYLACESKDWDKCTDALGHFFNVTDFDACIEYYVHAFSNTHLLRWWIMLSETDLDEEAIAVDDMISTISNTLVK